MAGRDGCSLETVSLRFAGSSWGVVCRAPLCTACRSTFSWPQIQRQEAEQRSLRAGGRGWRVQEGPEVGTGTTRGEVVWGKSVTGQTLAVAAPEGAPGWSLSHVCNSKPGRAQSTRVWTHGRALGPELCGLGARELKKTPRDEACDRRGGDGWGRGPGGAGQGAGVHTWWALLALPPTPAPWTVPGSARLGTRADPPPAPSGWPSQPQGSRPCVPLSEKGGKTRREWWEACQVQAGTWRLLGGRGRKGSCFVHRAESLLPGWR